MIEAIFAVFGVVVGLVLGYFTRLTEFRRDHRLDAYSAFIAAFLTVAHTGAALVSAGIQQGEAFFDQDNYEHSKLLWESYGAAAQAFEESSARLSLVSSDPVREDASVLERFIEGNVRNIHPIARGVYSIPLSPSEIDSESGRLALAFASRSRDDVTRWHQLKGARRDLS